MRRLNKYITDAGYCSRREADNYISQGRVTINGRETTLGDMVDETDIVEVDGEKIKTRTKHRVYIACNKPVGVTCTSEKSDKTNIIDFIGYKERIFPVGRLDKDSEGLIILTNDGDIVNKILRAGNNNPKEYVVTVDKPMTHEFISNMSNGVHILGVITKQCKIFRKSDTTFTVHLTQGLNRQIRRMCQALGYKVIRLKRVKVLNIELGNLEPGRWRYITPAEAMVMHALLVDSSGTEEASNEVPAAKATSFSSKKTGVTPQKIGSYGTKSTDATRRTTANKPKPSLTNKKNSEPRDVSASKRNSSETNPLKKKGSYSEYRKKGKINKPKY